MLEVIYSYRDSGKKICKVNDFNMILVFGYY